MKGLVALIMFYIFLLSSIKLTLILLQMLSLDKAFAWHCIPGLLDAMANKRSSQHE